MKKGTKILCAAMTATIAAGSAFALAACQKPLDDAPLTGTMLADFSDGASAAFFESDGWCNGDVFNVTWTKDNVAFDGGAAKLKVSEASETAEIPYLGGELRTYQHFGYGDYTVRMKPAKVTGTASAFFTYTGPSEEDENGDPNPHDEIDIEFLGTDTTHVQFNYFVNGVGGHEHMYDLGFDASLEYHDYGFRWAEDHIVWFVDGKPVYKVEASDKNPLPSTPGRILMNHWCGTEKAEGWMGKYAGSDGKVTEYKSVKTSATPIGEIPEIVDPGDLTVPEDGWTDIDYSAFGFNNGYAVDKTDGITMSHSAAVNEWACEGMDLADSYSWVKFHIKNNSEQAANVRMDIKKLNGAGGVVGIVSDGGVVSVGTADSCAMIGLEGGEETDVAIKIKDIYVDQIVVFLNSVGANRATEGSITITDLKGIVNENVEPPAPVENPTVKVGENEVMFAGSGYTISSSDDKAAMTVEYTDISGKGYTNIKADFSEFIGDSNVFTVTIKNEGAETAKIRLDIDCNVGEGSEMNDGSKNSFCNISAEYTGTVVASGNDYLYGGGDWVQIAAGETITVKIAFTTGVGAKGVTFFIDSSTWDDETTHTGKVIFSGMNLSKEEVEA